MVGASWALTISFAVLALAWREPRFEAEPRPEDPRPRRPWLAVARRADRRMVPGRPVLPAPTTHPTAGSVRSTSWCGSAWCPLALLAGHVWRDLSPWRSVQALVGRLSGRPDGFVAYPAWLGYWPAVAGLLAFVWLELASPDPGDIGAVRIWVAVYVVVTIAGGIVFGPRWHDRADPFDVYSGVVAHLSPFVRDRRLDVHNPLRTLPQIPVAPRAGGPARDAARLDRVRQLLGVVVLAVEGAVGARAEPDARGLLRRGGGAVPARDPRHRWRHARGARRPARPARPLAGADRGRLHLRPLPDVSRREGPGRGLRADVHRRRRRPSCSPRTRRRSPR